LTLETINNIAGVLTSTQAFVLVQRLTTFQTVV